MSQMKLQVSPAPAVRRTIQRGETGSANPGARLRLTPGSVSVPFHVSNGPRVQASNEVSSQSGPRRRRIIQRVKLDLALAPWFQGAVAKVVWTAKRTPYFGFSRTASLYVVPKLGLFGVLQQPLCGPGKAIAACKVAPILHVRRAVPPFQGWILDGWTVNPGKCLGWKQAPFRGQPGADPVIITHPRLAPDQEPGRSSREPVSELSTDRLESPSRRVQIIQDFQFIQMKFQVSRAPGGAGPFKE